MTTFPRRSPGCCAWPRIRARSCSPWANTFKSITEGNFNSVGASYRPSPWPPKRDGSVCNLQLSTTLAHAFHLEVSPTAATLSNSTKYAAIHQFGGVIKPVNAKSLSWIGSDGKRRFAKSVTIPARPFFPVLNGRLTPAAAEKIGRAGERVMLREGGAPASP